jgi:hypothetical protein
MPSNDQPVSATESSPALTENLSAKAPFYRVLALSADVTDEVHTSPGITASLNSVNAEADMTHCQAGLDAALRRAEAQNGPIATLVACAGAAQTGYFTAPTWLTPSAAAPTSGAAVDTTAAGGGKGKKGKGVAGKTEVVREPAALSTAASVGGGGGGGGGEGTERVLALSHFRSSMELNYLGSVSSACILLIIR